MFVRHALPGERVRARLTQAGETDRFWRADAVEVLTASPDRVPAPCPYAGPGRCGGCDWQHASLPAQRRLKAAVVVEQLTRLGHLPADHPALTDLTVTPLPAPLGVDQANWGRSSKLGSIKQTGVDQANHDHGLGWRTRVRFTVDDTGRPGFHPHRSHDVIPVDHCPIADPRIDELGVGRRRWPGTSAVDVVAAGSGERLVVVEPLPGRRTEVPPLGADAAVAHRAEHGLRRLRGRIWVNEEVQVDAVARPFRVTGSGFWQVHPAAAQVLLDAVLDATVPAPGERALDLYGGVGLFAAGLAMRVGPEGLVLHLESDERACADARRSLHDLPQVRVEQGRVERTVARWSAPGGPLDGGADVVVLDPPRAGAGRRVIEAVTGLRPRVIAYVACDPAALARDVAFAAEAGYRLSGLRAFDAFPMTHHVECVARLVPDR